MMKQERQSMQVTSPPKPRFDPSINYGHILTAVVLVTGFGGWLWNDGKNAAEFRASIDKIAQNYEFRVSAIEKLSVQYVPVIQSLEKSDGRQEDRMDNMAEAIRQVRDHTQRELGAIRVDFADMNKSMTSIRENFAKMDGKIDLAIQRSTRAN